VLEGAQRCGARALVVRPGIVYGGAQGAVGDLLQAAANGLIRVIGDGSNRWPSIYDRDLAELYVRLASHPDAEGVFHATDHADERVDDIVEAIARHARTRPDVRHVRLAEARSKPGPYADALALDQVIRSPRARAIGWTPSLHSITGNIARLFEEFRSAQAAA
jgi:nucleoside-diphosphate-sugar epimerase